MYSLFEITTAAGSPRTVMFCGPSLLCLLDDFAQAGLCFLKLPRAHGCLLYPAGPVGLFLHYFDEIVNPILQTMSCDESLQPAAAKQR